MTDQLKHEKKYKAALIEQNIASVTDTTTEGSGDVVVTYDSKGLGVLDGPAMSANSEATSFPEYWRDLGFEMEKLLWCDENDNRSPEDAMQIVLELTKPSLRH